MKTRIVCNYKRNPEKQLKTLWLYEDEKDKKKSNNKGIEEEDIFFSTLFLLLSFPFFLTNFRLSYKLIELE